MKYILVLVLTGSIGFILFSLETYRELRLIKSTKTTQELVVDKYRKCVGTEEVYSCEELLNQLNKLKLLDIN